MHDPSQLAALPESSPRLSAVPNHRLEDLIAQAENHERLYRPNEMKVLERHGLLKQVLESRARYALNLLANRPPKMQLHEARELAMEELLPPPEDLEQELASEPDLLEGWLKEKQSNFLASPDSPDGKAERMDPTDNQ